MQRKVVLIGNSLLRTEHAFVVVLTDPETRLRLPFTTGPSEAYGILASLEGTQTARPTTHDLLLNIASRLSVVPKDVTITGVEDGMFVTVIRLFDSSTGEDIWMDCRPSDGIALALRRGIPIYIEDEVFFDGIANDGVSVFLDELRDKFPDEDYP